VGGIAVPGGDPDALDELAFRLEFAAQGTADLGASTRAVSTSVTSDADWIGDAADSYTAFSGDLGQGASAAESPLLRIASAVRTYAGSLRTAQQQAQAYTSIAEAAQNDTTGSLIGAAERAGQNAEDAINAMQAAGNQAAAEVTSAAGDLDNLFGGQGPVQGWINGQPTLSGDSLPGGGIFGGSGDSTDLWPEFLGNPGAPDLGLKLGDPIPTDLGPEILGNPGAPDLGLKLGDPIPTDLGPEILVNPGGSIGSLINFEAPATNSQGESESEPEGEPEGEPEVEPTPAASVPQEAQNALNEIDKGQWPPQDIQGGGTFQNDGRGGGEVLPREEPNGTQITYQEWDVNPAGPNGRDAIRIVTGSDGSAYYTDNHYNTFTKIR
jgi:ribonuclease T1